MGETDLGGDQRPPDADETLVEQHARLRFVAAKPRLPVEQRLLAMAAPDLRIGDHKARTFHK